MGLNHSKKETKQGKIQNKKIELGTRILKL